MVPSESSIPSKKSPPSKARCPPGTVAGGPPQVRVRDDGTRQQAALQSGPLGRHQLDLTQPAVGILAEFPLDRIPDGAREPFGIDRSLHQVILCSSRNGFLTEGSVGQASEDDDRHGTGLEQHPTQTVQPVAIGQPQIEEDAYRPPR